MENPPSVLVCASGEQAASRLDQVARPHQLVAAEVVVALAEAPRTDRLAMIPPRKCTAQCARIIAVPIA
jgi:hypothetical protein